MRSNNSLKIGTIFERPVIIYSSETGRYVKNGAAQEKLIAIDGDEESEKYPKPVLSGNRIPDGGVVQDLTTGATRWVFKSYFEFCVTLADTIEPKSEKFNTIW